MPNSLKDLLIGPPLPTRQLAEKRLNKIRALATFSPDALSSIAYAVAAYMMLRAMTRLLTADTQGAPSGV